MIPADHTTIVLPLDFMGHDFEIELSCSVWSYATPETGRYGPPEFYDPGESADFTIDEIILREDRPNGMGPDFEATGALFSHFCERFWDECEAAANSLSPGEPYEYDEDYYRDER